MTACVSTFFWAQYSIKCYTEEYDAYVLGTALMAAFYSLGIPLMFYYLVQRFKDDGKRGDKVVQAALDWAYSPFRLGREWWHVL